MGYVYKHTRLDTNDVFYIGVGGLSKNDRYKRAHSKASRNRYWKHIVSITDYTVEIIFENENPVIVKEKEKEYILLYGRKENNTGTLCNMTDGGDGSYGVIQSKETIEKRTEKLRGENNYWFGRKMTVEQKRVLSEAKLGKKYPNSRSEKTRKIRSIQEIKRKIDQFTLQGEFVKSYYGFTEVQKAGFNRANIYFCCVGKRNTSRGYIWKFDETYVNEHRKSHLKT